jgi:hypothetical protein
MARELPPVVIIPGTPAGSYTLTVSGVSGGATQTIQLTLNVN